MFKFQSVEFSVDEIELWKWNFFWYGKSISKGSLCIVGSSQSVRNFLCFKECQVTVFLSLFFFHSFLLASIFYFYCSNFYKTQNEASLKGVKPLFTHFVLSALKLLLMSEVFLKELMCHLMINTTFHNLNFAWLLYENEWCCISCKLNYVLHCWFSKFRRTYIFTFEEVSTYTNKFWQHGKVSIEILLNSNFFY